MQMDFVHYRPPVQRDSGGKSDRCATKMTTFKDEAKHIDVRDKSAHEAMGHVNGACPHEGGEAETSARPRLSPEQVWLLEQQFLAEPKPSTSTKRHLADLTNLSLTRVSVSLMAGCMRRCGIDGSRTGSRTAEPRQSSRGVSRKCSYAVRLKTRATATVPRDHLLRRGDPHPGCPT